MLLVASACSPVKTVQRRPPLSRVVVGGNSGSASASDGSEGGGTMVQAAYVPGAQRADEGGGWKWRPGISVQQWDIDDSYDAPAVLFRDVELFMRQPDLLASRDSRWFRLGAQVGTFWADYKVDGLRASTGYTPGSARWRAIPFLAYRGTIEPEALVMFGGNWEVTAFANLHGGVGLAYPSNGGGDTSAATYNPTGMLDFGYELGARATFGPVFGQLSLQTRYLQGSGSSAVTSDGGVNYYPDVESESSTIQGVWLLVGVAF